MRSEQDFIEPMEKEKYGFKVELWNTFEKGEGGDYRYQEINFNFIPIFQMLWLTGGLPKYRNFSINLGWLCWGITFSWARQEVNP